MGDRDMPKYGQLNRESSGCCSTLRRCCRCCGKCARCIFISFCVVISISLLASLVMYVIEKATPSSPSSSDAEPLPLVKPPVEASTPSGLSGSASLSAHGLHLSALDPSEVKDRFFNPAGGPANLFNILADVDLRIKGINDRRSQFGCLNSTTAVQYNLSAWTGNATFYAQCAEEFTGNMGFVAFGLVNDIFYVYVRSTETSVAAQVRRDATRAVTRVDVWYSVGIANRNGSHGVVHIRARPGVSPIFEMVVTGNGLGYCGAQLRSDNVTMNVTGSAGNGQCAATDSVCTSAASLTTTATCSETTNSFELTPLGRVAYRGPDNANMSASAYPGGEGNTVWLDWTAADDTEFGPAVSPVPQ